MAGKKIVLGQDARAEMIKGVNAVANAVKVTLGPRGRNVAIDNGFGAPKITKDGVSVAKIVTLKDPSQNIGAQLMKNAASAADNDAGDGTTTATVLTQAMIHRANKSIVAGANPMDLKRGIDIAVETIINGLKQRSKKVSSNEEIQQVGTISSNGDAKIGELLTKALDAVGPEGIITVEQGKTLEDELELTEGFKLDRGYVSPYFVTNQEKMVVELDSPYILLYDKKLSNLQQILPILENLIQTGKPLFIIADEIEGEALATLIYNKMRGIIKVAAIKAPGFGDRKKATMEDIAVLTGGQVITEETGIKIENVALEVLGKAKKIIVNKDFTTIIDGDGNKNDISSRVQQLKNQISETTSDYDKEKLQERLAKLAGGVAVLKVGGVTEIEVKERKDRVEDALNATKAAVEQGIIAGGGIALFVSTSLLDNIKGENADQQNGVKIVREALEAPLRQIVENAGLDGSGIIAQLLTTNKGNNFGYDAQKLKYVDMFEAGIIDPTKVVISALKNAASVASSIICTEALITDEQDNATGGSARPGMGGMGDMDGMGGF